MSIMIGSARGDENGKAKGGAAGDQKQTSSLNDTKGEVSMQTMYVHSKGWYILRPKNAAHAELIACKMITACNNSNIGYDQGGRLGIITHGVSSTTKTECDCSSLARDCIKEATGIDPGNFTTANEVTVLEATGLFEKRIAYVSQTKTPVYNGDVLVTKTKGHTAIVVSGNPRNTGSSATATIGSQSTSGYYSKYTGKTLSIVTALKAVGESDTSFSHRKEIAQANSITNYKGTAAQNMSMLKMLKAGTLKKV